MHTHPRPDDDVEGEAAEGGEGEIGAAHRHQGPADHESGIPGAGHVDTGDVGRLRVLTHRPQIEPEMGSPQHPPRQRGDQQEAHIGEPVLAEQVVGPKRFPGRIGLDPAKALSAAEHQTVDVLGDSDQAKGGSDPGHMLVGADGDGQEAHERPRRQPHNNRRQETH